MCQYIHTVYAPCSHCHLFLKICGGPKLPISSINKSSKTTNPVIHPSGAKDDSVAEGSAPTVEMNKTCVVIVHEPDAHASTRQCPRCARGEPRDQMNSNHSHRMSFATEAAKNGRRASGITASSPAPPWVLRTGTLGGEAPVREAPVTDSGPPTVSAWATAPGRVVRGQRGGVNKRGAIPWKMDAEASKSDEALNARVKTPKAAETSKAPVKTSKTSVETLKTHDETSKTSTETSKSTETPKTTAETFKTPTETSEVAQTSKTANTSKAPSEVSKLTNTAKTTDGNEKKVGGTFGKSDSAYIAPWKRAALAGGDKGSATVQASQPAIVPQILNRGEGDAGGSKQSDKGKQVAGQQGQNVMPGDGDGEHKGGRSGTWSRRNHRGTRGEEKGSLRKPKNYVPAESKENRDGPW